MNHSDLSPCDGGSRCGLFVFHISRTYRYPLPALCLVEDVSIFLILVFLLEVIAMNEFWKNFVQKESKEDDEVPREIIYMIKRVYGLIAEIQSMSSFAIAVYKHSNERATADMTLFFNTKMSIIFDFKDIEKYVKFKITSNSENEHFIEMVIDYDLCKDDKDMLAFLRNIESIYRSSTDLVAEFYNKHRHDVMHDDGRRPQYLH